MRARGLITIGAGAAAVVAFGIACGTLDSSDPGSDGGPNADAIAPDTAFDATPDAGSTDGGSSDGRCAIGAPFGPPVAITSLNTTSTLTNEANPWLTPDELTIFFSHFDSPSAHIRVAKRSSVTAQFDASSQIGPLVQTNEIAPSLARDGTLYFPGRDTGPWQLYSAPSLADGGFGSVASLPTDPAVNVAGYSQTTLVVSAAGDEIFFTSDRGIPSGTATDIYRVARVGGVPSGVVTLVAELSTVSAESHPVLSEDALTMYFATSRNAQGWQGGDDIWYATRPSVGAAFTNVTRVAELNSAGDDQPGWLSVDQCRLYMSSTRGASELRLYVATRAP